MSNSTPNNFEPGELADLVAAHLGFEPAGHVALVAFTDEPRVLHTEYPLSPESAWPVFVEEFIGYAAERLRSGGVPNHVVLLLFAHLAVGPESIEEHTLLGRLLSAECHRHGLVVGGRQFVTATHWWHLPGFPTPDGPGDGTARLSATAEPGAADREAELEAGDAQVVVQTLADLAELLAGGQEIEEIPVEQIARLLIASQNSAFRSGAATHCEPGEVGRIRRLWSRAATLCVVEYAQLAAAPLTLLGIALILEGDEAASAEALRQALSLKPHYEDTAVALRFAELAEIARPLGLPPEVAAGELRRHLLHSGGAR